MIVDDEAAEIAVGVFALRKFRISLDGYLQPVSFASDTWADGTAIAACARQWHQAPDADCTCGLYSFTDLHELRTQYRQAGHIVAVVALEGVSFQGTMGWRSQAARVVALWMKPTYSKQLSARRVALLRANYPEVDCYEDRAVMLARYPELIPPPNPRRAALVQACRRTAAVIGHGMMSGRSAAGWIAVTAALFTAMALLSPSGTWLAGEAVLSTLWLSLVPGMAVFADGIMVIGKLVHRGGRVSPVWLPYRPNRYSWWLCSAVLTAATITVHGHVHLPFIALYTAGLLALRLTEVFVLAIPRQLKTGPNLKSRLGIRKLPTHTEMTTADGIATPASNCSAGSVTATSSSRSGSSTDHPTQQRTTDMADIGEGDNPRRVEILPTTAPVLPAHPAPAPAPGREPTPTR